MDPTPVNDDEWLYRSVRANSAEYKRTPEGLKVSRSAFSARDNAPSVDRSSLRNNPADTRLNASDGIVRLLTRRVREIGNIRTNPNDINSDRTYAVDAVHRPLSVANGDERDNDAHCQIECTPDIAMDNHFKRLREALARIADEQGWVVPPIE